MKNWFLTAIPALLILSFPSCKNPSKEAYAFPFQNPDLTMEKRAEDLVSRLSLDQKIAQLMNQAPAID
ncbi:MAG TPA: hypothetical protein PKL70_19930, partial [Saprospiraceae bacterium]|nr:hypothetical protein [Saprospiraceae bacterium]